MSIEERSTLVYSTALGGRVKQEKPKAARPKGDGGVRLQLKRLGGKMASVVVGVPLDEPELKELGRELKQKCGVGGSVKDFAIEIQGDKRNVLKAELEKRGYTVKLAGG